MVGVFQVQDVSAHGEVELHLFYGQQVGSSSAVMCEVFYGESLDVS